MRPTLTALEGRDVPALLAIGSASFSDGFSSASVSYSVESDAPGHPGKYVWRYEVTNSNIGYNDLEAYLANDTGMGFYVDTFQGVPVADVTYEYLEPDAPSGYWFGAWGGDHMTGQFIPHGATAVFTLTTEPLRIVDARASLDMYEGVVKGPGQPKVATATDMDAAVIWPDDSFTPTGVTLSATVTTASGSCPLMGAVIFRDGSTIIGSAAPTEVGPGVWKAEWSGALPYGSHAYTAEYEGDDRHKKSSSVVSLVNRTALEESEEAADPTDADAPRERDPATLQWSDYRGTRPADGYDAYTGGYLDLKYDKIKFEQVSQTKQLAPLNGVPVWSAQVKGQFVNPKVVCLLHP